MCSVSGIASSTHKLSWSTTSQHSDTILAAVQVHRQRNGCFIMTSTLHLAEPVVSHIGQHWCVLSSPNRTFLLQSSSFSLLSPAHYSHKPACKHPDHSRQLETRDITENNSSSGDGGDLIPGGVIAAVVIVVVMVVIAMRKSCSARERFCLGWTAHTSAVQYGWLQAQPGEEC